MITVVGTGFVNSVLSEFPYNIVLIVLTVKPHTRTALDQKRFNSLMTVLTVYISGSQTVGHASQKMLEDLTGKARMNTLIFKVYLE